ncbi:MAG: hypothetical protein ACHBN1_13125 [Heteroscytonema crispum UTEX LB 1556]
MVRSAVDGFPRLLQLLSRWVVGCWLVGVGARSLQSGRFPPASFAPLVGEPLRSWGLAKGRSGVFPTQATGSPVGLLVV